MPYTSYGYGGYNKNQIKALARLLELSGEETADIIYNSRPDAAPTPTLQIKKIPISETHLITPDAFAGEIGEIIAQNIGINQLENVGQKGDLYLKSAFILTIRRLREKNPTDPNLKRLNDYISASPAWQ